MQETFLRSSFYVRDHFIFFLKKEEKEKRMKYLILHVDVICCNFFFYIINIVVVTLDLIGFMLIQLKLYFFSV